MAIRRGAVPLDPRLADHLRTVARFDTLRLPAAGAAVIVLLGGLGVLATVGLLPAPAVRLFDLDAEWNVPAVWSAALLAVAGAVAILVAVAERWVALGALGGQWLFMATDELCAVHERLEAATGVDWQTLYLPVFLLIGVAFLRVVGTVRRLSPRVVGLLFGGAACWAASQVLEKVQWDGDVKVPGYAVMMIGEELLEMAGSLFFVVAAVALSTVRRPGAGTSDRSGARAGS